jgi:Helix-turn-helix domain of resolvase.
LGQGRTSGRRTVITAQKIAVARQLYDSKEHTIEAIARTLGASRATIYRHRAPEPNVA